MAAQGGRADDEQLPRCRWRAQRPLIPPVIRASSRRVQRSAAEAEIGWVVDLVTAIRSVRAEMNIPPATLMPLVLVGASDGDPEPGAALERRRSGGMARLSGISFATAAAGRRGATVGARRGRSAAAQGRDRLRAERARLEKEIAKADADIKRVDAKLGNAEFMAQRAGRDRRRGARKARGSRGSAAQRSSRRWSG